jgi:hypothetical protein
MKTSIFFYCTFAAIVVGGVLFGLDWQAATLSPMPPIQVVAVVMPPPPPVPPPVKSAAPAAALNPVAQSPEAPKVAAPMLVAPGPKPAPAPVANAKPATTPPENVTAPVNPPAALAAQASPKPLCDVAACAAAYRSFRESDCTFNPSVGPRQLCTKGVVPGAAATTPAAATATDAQPSIIQEEPGRPAAAQPAAQPNAKCNVSACAAAYHTFTESDCTFMASGGQRKLCTK